MNHNVRQWVAALPVRVDDWRFWPLAAFGLALRWLALQLDWWALRDAVAHAAGALSGTALDGPGVLALGDAHTVRITASCTHVEVFALLCPLLWDRERSVSSNAAALGGFGVALFAAATARISLAVALTSAGVPWLWAHDAVLGVFYFGLMAFVLGRGAWTAGGDT